MLLGPDCGSWGLPARSTSQRTYVNPFGAMHLPFVSDANMSISRNLGCIDLPINLIRMKTHICELVPLVCLDFLRVVLICMVLLARHCYFTLEHPAQTLLARHARWEAFCNLVCYASCLIYIMYPHEFSKSQPLTAAPGLPPRVLDDAPRSTDSKEDCLLCQWHLAGRVRQG